MTGYRIPDIFQLPELPVLGLKIRDFCNEKLFDYCLKFCVFHFIFRSSRMLTKIMGLRWAKPTCWFVTSTVNR